MRSPEMILTWLETNVKGMRRSRMKTLAAIVPAAAELSGVGVLPLGRAMSTQTTAKHNIKRVNGFLDNSQVEGQAIAQGLFEAFAPKKGPVLVLADWTDVSHGKMPVFALPCNGRSIPFFVKVLPKRVGEGEMVQAENEALEALKDICCARQGVIIVADRGFGNQRWLGAAVSCGFHFVQRLSSVFQVDVEQHIGGVKAEPAPGKQSQGLGGGTMGNDEASNGRLATVYDRKAKEPWYLVTDMDDITAGEVVSVYRRRWWIEKLFPDKKNRDWDMGLAAVHLKDYSRYERMFYIVALAFILLSAHGAAAEAEGFDRKLRANTCKMRVINLLRMGFLYIRQKGVCLEYVLDALRHLVMLQVAPNWG